MVDPSETIGLLTARDDDIDGESPAGEGVVGYFSSDPDGRSGDTCGEPPAGDGAMGDILDDPAGGCVDSIPFLTPSLVLFRWNSPKGVPSVFPPLFLLRQNRDPHPLKLSPLFISFLLFN